MDKKVSISRKSAILTIVAFSFFIINSLWAGTTGKLSGRVFDQSTDDPLVGANVIIEGTTMGASTDQDGYYFIINVPPGVYSVSVSYIGYEKVTISEVIVMVDRTTSIDFALAVTAIAGKEVTVVAQRPIIDRDVTGSALNLDADYIGRSPIIDLTDAIRQQTGIYHTGETTYLRGGLSSEVDYRIDGASLNSGLLSDNYQRLNMTAVQELSILMGGYNAEYGQAMSGVVNVVTKEAAPAERSLHSNIAYRLRPPGQYHWGKNMYDKSLWKYTNYDLAHWQAELEGQPEVLAAYFKRFYGPGTETNNSKWDGTEVPTSQELLDTYREQITPDPVLGDYTERAEHDIEGSIWGSPMKNVSFLLSGAYKGGVNIWPQSLDYNPEYNIQAKINYFLSSDKKLSLNLMRGWYRSSTYTESNWNNFESSREAQWQPNADVRDPYTGQAYAPWGGYWLKGPEEKTVNLAALKWQHTLSPATFYTVQLSYLLDDMTSLQDYDRWLTTESTVGWGDSWFDLGGNFRLESRQIQVNNYSTSKVYAAKGDLTSQVHRSHQFKTGAEFKLFDVDYQHYYMEYPAGDVWHLDNVFSGKPVDLAAYIQDKMEYEGLIVNVGLRIDAFNARYKYPESFHDPLVFEERNGGDGINPSNTAPIWQSYMDPKDWFAYAGVGTAGPPVDYKSFFVGKEQDKNTVDSEWKFALAPRIGLSFPIATTSKLRFSYGHFYQRPSWAKIMGFPTSWYDSAPLASVRMDQWQGWYGQPGLTYEKTIQYELGVTQNILNILRLDLVGYYKDASRLTRFSHSGTYNQSGGGFAETGWAAIWDLPSTSRNVANDGHDNIFYTNKIFKDIRGIETTIEKLWNGVWSANLILNYGLSTGGMAGYREYTEDPDVPDQPHWSFSETKVTWISSYIIKGNINYITPSGLGPMGLIGDVSIGLYHEYFSGPEYTYYPVDYTGLREPNNKRWFPHNRTDLKFVKRLPLGNITPVLGLEIFNLLNSYDRILLGGDDLKKWEESGGKEIPKHWQSGEENLWWFYNSVSSPKRMVYLTLSIEL